MSWIDVMVEHKTHSLSRSFVYYAPGPIAPGIRVRVPFGKQQLVGLVVSMRPENYHPGFKVKNIIEVLDQSPVLNPEQIELARRLSWRTISPFMSMVDVMLPAALKASSKHKAMIERKVLIKNRDFDPETGLNEKLREAYDQIEEGMSLKQAKTLMSDYRINQLVSTGALIKETRPVAGSILEKREQKPWPELNLYQKNSLNQIHASSRQTILLHGITGSGKTEVFFHLARQALDQKKQVLILVPEISLTPMMKNRLAERFTEDIYVVHSSLSNTELLCAWNGVSKGEPCIVIGTRKSVFLPFTDLGVIIMDEEHEGSYKQDQSPRYHARDAALIRAANHHCKLILASATPSLESYARAIKGVYGLAELPQRASGKPASIRRIDLKTTPVYTGFSAELIQAITDRLAKKEKTLLLLNRRGYLPTVRCTSCHEYLTCPDCGIPLSYHKNEDALVCHICGRRFETVQECPNCHAHTLSRTGQGTERLEEDARQLFSKAKIIRMDHDTTTRKGSHERLLREFEEDGDILMGTQMIAKGLDYPDLTLSAILGIDSLLARPDFFAAEKAYQLAEQAAGRAGRGDRAGEVIIQSYRPEHFVLSCIQNHSYRDFFVQEMKYRHAGGNPPYCYMASLIFKGDELMDVYAFGLDAKDFLDEQELTVLGPSEISMRNAKSRVRLILKDRDENRLIETLWKFVEWMGRQKQKDISFDVDVNPMNMEE